MPRASRRRDRSLSLRWVDALRYLRSSSVGSGANTAKRARETSTHDVTHITHRFTFISISFDSRPDALLDFLFIDILFIDGALFICWVSCRGLIVTPSAFTLVLPSPIHFELPRRAFSGCTVALNFTASNAPAPALPMHRLLPE